jgi:hypothetical protein
MNRRQLVTASALFVLALGPSSPRAQDGPSQAEAHAEIPGTHISLRIPQGFALREGFPGLLRADIGAFVLANEIDVPVAEVLADMTAEAMAADGVTLIRSDEVTVSGQPATLFHTRQENDGGARKWFLLFGSDTGTVMLAASAPLLLEGELGAALEQTLLTAKWEPDRVIDPYAGMGFSLRSSETFEIRGRKPGGVLLARKDAPQELTPAEPILVIYSATSAAVAPLAVLARQQLTENPQFTEFSNFVEHPLQVNGLSGYEIVADAKETSQAVPVRILLIAVRASERDMILEAVVAPEAWDKYLPEFRALIESFQVTAAGHSH